MKKNNDSIVNQEFEINKNEKIIELLEQIISVLKMINRNTFPGH